MVKKWLQEWMRDYHLFLFDFDGLLVNTEHLHYEAYQIMCQSHGYSLGWDFSQYCQIAHLSSSGIQEQIYKQFPELQRRFPDWNHLYQEKKQAYLSLLSSVDLMPGVEEFLSLLQKNHKRHVVVTHSPKEQIDQIKEQHPVLKQIPFWMTREDYKNPKPSPECYIKAIEKYGEGKKAIGFEDSPRGLEALKGSLAQPVFVSQLRYPRMEEILQGTIHLADFDELLES